MSSIDESIDIENRLVDVRGKGGRVMGSECNEDEVSYGGDDDVLELDSGDGAQLWSQTRCILHVKRVGFMVYELHINKPVI